MSSLNTNASAMTALQSLASTNKNLGVTQSRISTGLRVAEAADNAAYWSIATTMRSDNKAFSAVQDSLGLGAGKLDTAYTAMNASIELVDEIKQKLVSAVGASGEDKVKIQTEITELQNQLKGVVKSANYAGTNLIYNNAAATPPSPTTLDIVASYNRASDGTISIEKISLDLSASEIFLMDDTEAAGLLGTAGATSTVSVLDLTLGTDPTAATADAAIETLIGEVDAVLGSMADAASTLGAAKKRVDIQKDFVTKLQDAIDRGIGQLVDADMERESARLSALQVQQQLGIQALSIANSNTQSILSLFR